MCFYIVTKCNYTFCSRLACKYIIFCSEKHGVDQKPLQGRRLSVFVYLFPGDDKPGGQPAALFHQNVPVGGQLSDDLVRVVPDGEQADIFIV